MKEMANRRWLWFYTLLAAIVPSLVGYDIYYQLSTPLPDFGYDGQTGLVVEVPQRSYANYAGLLVGDNILYINDIPFNASYRWTLGNHQAVIERAGEQLLLELPIVSMARITLPSLVSAAIVALIFWATGLILLLRRFEQSEVRLLFLLAQVFAIVLLFPLAHPWPSPVPLWASDLSSAALYLAGPLLLHYYATFPVKLGTPQQRRWGMGAIYGLSLLAIVSWQIGGGRGWSRWGAIYTILEVSAAVAILVYVYSRRANPEERRRLRLVVLGNLMAALPPILFYILPIMTQSPYYIPEWLTGLFLVTAPLSYLYATVRHNLFGIDRLLNRALVYTLLSLGILALYLGPFLLIYRLRPGDLLLQSFYGAALTLLVGLGFDWTRTRVERMVDQLFYGGWYDYAGVVESVSEALSRSLDRQQLSKVLTRQVPDLMQLGNAELQFIGAEAVAQSSSGNPWRFSLSFQGTTQAIWTVSAHQNGEELTYSDRRILETLAHQAEIALSNVLLVEELRRQIDQIRQAQHQLLRTREDERARLARDLHDGPIQALVGLNLRIGLLSSSKKKVGLPQELVTMRAEVKQLLSELRRVCTELRPPMLDTLGLGAAIRALTEEWSLQWDIAVQTNLPPDAALRYLPAEAAVNLYRILQEALANTAQHAEAQQAIVRLEQLPPCLVLTIQDDGKGFVVPATFHDLAIKGHFGLLGIEERAGLLGGHCTIESRPGQGTTIRVSVLEGKRDDYSDSVTG